MRRLLVVGLVLGLGGIAAILPAPEAPPDPLASLVIIRPGIESPVDASIWYCPWAQANASRDSFFGVATLTDADAEFTLPVAIPGEPPDEASVETLGPGAAVVTLSDIAQRGDSPGFVEFSDGPAAVGVTVIGDVVTADTCVAQGPDEWFFAGGSTLVGEKMRLRLFNPFPETAKVTVTGFSEIGVEALGELRSISINPRSWRDIDFEEMLRQRQALIISVRVDEGLVVPAMSYTAGEDEAWWLGTDLSTEWEFPVARVAGLEDAAIVVGNPNLVDVTVTVDLYTSEGPQRAAFEFTVPPEAPLRIGLGEVTDDVVGVRVAASTPVVAGVVAAGGAGTAVTGGAPVTARTWLLPGLRTLGLNEGTLWLLNSSFEQISVTVSELTGVAAINTQILVEPGTQVAIQIVEPDALGVLVEASDPFTAAWSIQGPSGAAFSGGLPVVDD
ncbi:MAG: DUF5719 family protein [Acidimicrobiia bacterium]